jgi:hypothetical protein
MKSVKVTKRKIVELLSIRNKAQGAYLKQKDVDDFEAYRIPEIETVVPKPHDIQQSETEGRLPFDHDNYHCQEYGDLMNSVKDIRHEYAQSSDHILRKQLATKEIGHWHDYMQKREEMLPEKYQMKESTLLTLKDLFERESERRNRKLRSDRVINYHHSFANSFKFDLPINSRNLVQMIHPYHGYLCNIEDKQFSFDEMIKIYKQQIVSSYERELGQTYLADELA